jgi:hypothetical protein
MRTVQNVGWKTGRKETARNIVERIMLIGCGLDLSGSELGSVADSCEHGNET